MSSVDQDCTDTAVGGDNTASRRGVCPASRASNPSKAARAPASASCARCRTESNVAVAAAMEGSLSSASGRRLCCGGGGARTLLPALGACLPLPCHGCSCWRWLSTWWLWRCGCRTPRGEPSLGPTLSASLATGGAVSLRRPTRPRGSGLWTLVSASRAFRSRCVVNSSSNCATRACSDRMVSRCFPMMAWHSASSATGSLGGS